MNSEPTSIYGVRWLSWACATMSILSLYLCGTATAEVFNAAESFSGSGNPSGTFTYGYVDNTVGLTGFVTTDANGGFVPYANFADPATSGLGEVASGWTICIDGPACNINPFPQVGTLNVPSTLPAPYPGVTEDIPSSAGENADYPFGVVAGHGAISPAQFGYYGIQWTAPAGHSGPVDIEFKSWQVGLYPETSHGGANNPRYGGNVRPQQMLVQKVSGGTSETLAKTPQKARHGYINIAGTPQYTAQNTAANAARDIFVDIDGDVATFTTTPNDAVDCTSNNGFSAGCDGMGEIQAAIGSSLSPTTIRLTGINMNAGESIHISLANLFDSGQSGFYAMDLNVFTGEDRAATTRWDLATDWDVSGPTPGNSGRAATGRGPDAVWSYGTQKLGSFAPFDQVRYGGINSGAIDPVEQHGWGTVAPGWFDSSVVRGEDLPAVMPGIVVDFDGRNFTRRVNLTDDEAVDHMGDWSGGKIAIHTPPASFDSDETSTIRWTAPEDMTVDIDGGLWRLIRSDLRDEDLANPNGNTIQVDISGGVATLTDNGLDRPWPIFYPEGELTVNGSTFAVTDFVPDTNATQLQLANATASSPATSDFEFANLVDRDHEFELLHNGSSLVSPTLMDDLDFDCASGNNSFCPVDLSVSGLSVLEGDTLDLLIRPVTGATGTYIGVDFTVLAAVAPPGLPGDFNNDGIVSAVDYTVWRDNLGGDSSVLNGNGSGAQTVVQADYNLWKSSFGNSSTGRGAAVPEPMSLLLLCAGTLAGLAARRRG